MAISIPPGLTATCTQSSEGAAWLAGIPSVVGRFARRWRLTLGEPFEGSCSWVAPVMRADGSPAVLKVGMPHMEGRDEIAGLRFWNGDPTVRLLDSDDALGVMLLEHCEPGTPLRTRPESEQDVVIAGLLRRMWRKPAGQQSFRPLSEMTRYWSEATLSRSREWANASLVREGLRLFEALSQPSPEDMLLATDLHAGNVLAAARQPWLAIDPKPFVGDPAYDATQHLLNCLERLRTRPTDTIRRFSDLLGVHFERVRWWTFARTATEPRANWRADDLEQVARRLAP